MVMIPEKLVNIAGATCTGKSSLVAELMTRVGSEQATVLHFDEFDRFPPGKPLPHGIRNWEFPALFDMDGYLEALRNLKAGQPVYLDANSRESIDEGIANRVIQPKRFVFIEGVFSFVGPVAQSLTYPRFFVELQENEMVRRRLARSAGKNDPWDDPAYIRGPMVEGTRTYIRPQLYDATHILDGRRPITELADQVMEVLEI